MFYAYYHRPTFVPNQIVTTMRPGLIPGLPGPPPPPQAQNFRPAQQAPTIRKEFPETWLWKSYGENQGLVSFFGNLILYT